MLKETERRRKVTIGCELNCERGGCSNDLKWFSKPFQARLWWSRPKTAQTNCRCWTDVKDEETILLFRWNWSTEGKKKSDTLARVAGKASKRLCVSSIQLLRSVHVSVGTSRQSYHARCTYQWLPLPVIKLYFREYFGQLDFFWQQKIFMNDKNHRQTHPYAGKQTDTGMHTNAH